MNGYNFTERVRKVLAMAREEAARLHHEYVGTEHILLGLIREGEGVAATVTGTSVWLDWARGGYAVLLTNRVHPRRDRPEAALIKDLRRRFGDLAWALIER